MLVYRCPAGGRLIGLLSNLAGELSKQNALIISIIDKKPAENRKHASSSKPRIGLLTFKGHHCATTGPILLTNTAQLKSNHISSGPRTQAMIAANQSASPKATNEDGTSPSFKLINPVLALVVDCCYNNAVLEIPYDRGPVQSFRQSLEKATHH